MKRRWSWVDPLWKRRSRVSAPRLTASRCPPLRVSGDKAAAAAAAVTIAATPAAQASELGEVRREQGVKSRCEHTTQLLRRLPKIEEENETHRARFRWPWDGRVASSRAVAARSRAQTGGILYICRRSRLGGGFATPERALSFIKSRLLCSPRAGWCNDAATVG